MFCISHLWAVLELVVWDVHAVSLFPIPAVFIASWTTCSISSRTSYDNEFKTYDVKRILTHESTFDLEAYRNYSPLFLS